MEKADINVLIVDDVQAVRTNVKDLLKSYGFRNITVAANGAEAKHYLTTQKVHLVMCDWHMEVMDGFELLDFVRRGPDAALKDIGFLMVTADSTKEHVINAIKNGVDDYLVKPLTIGQIQDRVAKCLTKRGLD